MYGYNNIKIASIPNKLYLHTVELTNGYHKLSKCVPNVKPIIKYHLLCCNLNQRINIDYWLVV